MGESNGDEKYLKEGEFAVLRGKYFLDQMGKKKVAAYIEALEGMLMYMTKQLGGTVVVPRFVDIIELNMEMRISQLKNGDAEVQVRQL